MKKIIVSLICIVLIAFAFAGCSASRHRIYYEGNDIMDCPKSAEAGETVSLNTAVICDGDLIVSINGDGDFGHYTQSGKYEFVMPDEDVTIKTHVDTSGYAGA